MSNLPSTREAIREKFAGRNRAVIDAAQWFAYDHLAGSPARAAGTVIALNPRTASAMVAELAFDMIDDLPDSPELTHALRRLIEAKDCLVRAAIAATDGQPPASISGDAGPTPVQRLLELELPRNDADAPTVRAYLVALVDRVWREDEGFSGKRPFGNSGWQYDVYAPMVKAGIITGKLDEDGYIEQADTARADELILAAIASLGRPS